MGAPVHESFEPCIPVEEHAPIRLASVVSALSHALDLSTGQPIGHSVRACVLGMRIAREIGMNAETQSDLFYALLLKDCGCSGNASKTFHALVADDLKAKRDVKTTDWTRVGWESLQYALAHVAVGKPFLERAKALFLLALNQKTHARDVTKIRCERGSSLALAMGLSPVTANGILNLDEHWDGTGQPEGKHRLEIPILSRIMLLAQTLEVFTAASGEQAALQVVNARRGKWFDPDLVNATNALARRNELSETYNLSLQSLFLMSEPQSKRLTFGDTTADSNLDSICTAFSNIVDAKSPFTFNHSMGVANAAVATARVLGLPKNRILFVRHAALLHDLGKLGVSNAILEKPAKLDETEWQAMRVHPQHTWSILRGIPGFEEMSEVAGSHHEKLDGSGYFRGASADRISLEARILAVADIYDALAANRPYRDGMPRERVFEILRKDAPRALDADCVEALAQSDARLDQTYTDLHDLNKQLTAPTALSC